MALLAVIPLLGILLVWEIFRTGVQRETDAAVARYDTKVAPGPGELRGFVHNGDVDRVKSLLESGADANEEYENGFTSIYFAEDLRIVDLLIAHGAKLNIRDRATLQSPIEHAAENWERDPEHGNAWKAIIDKLRDAGAEYTIDTAIYMNDIQFVEKKLAAEDSWVNERRGTHSAPLRLAAHTGRVEICKLLLEHKADPNAFEEGCGFPIMVGAVNHPAVVKLLIEHGADLRREITWKCWRTGIWIIGDDATLLHHAAGDGHPETINLLIDNGVDIFATAHDLAGGDSQQTALEVAAFFGKADNANAIVSHPNFDKADPQSRQTVLDRSLQIGAFSSWLARDAQRFKLITILLDKGANPSVRQNGITAMQIAARQIHPDQDKENTETKRIIALLREHGAPVDFFSAVAIGDEAEVRRILKREPQLANTRAPDGYPALHFAVGMNYKSIVDAILDAGGEVDIRNKCDGTGYLDETGLHCAAFWGRDEIARRLIDAGADVNALTERKSTPLHDAARLTNVGMVRLLLERGAKPDARDKDNETPLDWCRKLKREQAGEIEALFREHH